MDKHTGIGKLLEINKLHAGRYDAPESTLARRLYRASHPTEIGVFKCMDGRLHLPVMTNTAVGILQPWRNLGGKFNLGWPGLLYTVREWVSYAISRGRNCMPIATYHFSRGDEHRGCKGFNYDTKAAIKFSQELKEQFDRVFGKGPVYAVQMGIETDLEALILHGDNGDMVDLSEISEQSTDDLQKLIAKLYPDMPPVMQADLLPIVSGNIAHIKDIRAENRPIAKAEHQEWVLGIGRGFDWLHEINTALLIGPYDPRLWKTIAVGAGLLLDNINSGRINPQDGVVLITSAIYRDPIGSNRNLAEEKTKFLHDFAVEVITAEVPDLLPHLEHLTTTVDMNTRVLDVLESINPK